VEEEALTKPGFVDPFEKLGRDNLVGVDVLYGDADHLAGQCIETLHGYRLAPQVSIVLISATTPLMALAAAVKGLARNVRPPRPCRPSKFRLLVETAY